LPAHPNEFWVIGFDSFFTNLGLSLDATDEPTDEYKSFGIKRIQNSKSKEGQHIVVLDCSFYKK
jgi:hypothetical protein